MHRQTAVEGPEEETEEEVARAGLGAEVVVEGTEEVEEAVQSGLEVERAVQYLNFRPSCFAGVRDEEVSFIVDAASP